MPALTSGPLNSLPFRFLVSQVWPISIYTSSQSAKKIDGARRQSKNIVIFFFKKKNQAAACASQIHCHTVVLSCVVSRSHSHIGERYQDPCAVK